MTKEEFTTNIKQALALNTLDPDISNVEIEFIVELMYNEDTTWFFNDFYEFALEVKKEDGDYLYVMEEYDVIPNLSDMDNEVFVRDWFADHKQAMEDLFKFSGLKNTKDYNQILFIDLDIICEWLYNHKQAYQDCIIYVSHRLKRKK